AAAPGAGAQLRPGHPGGGPGALAPPARLPEMRAGRRELHARQGSEQSLLTEDSCRGTDRVVFTPGRASLTGDSVHQLTHLQRKLVEASDAIRSGPPGRIDFLHNVQCQCGIPYNNPGDSVREWDRKQGDASLRIEAGSAIDPRTGHFVKLGLPF